MPSRPGISTSSSATSGRYARGRGDHLVAAADLGDHLEVRLQVEQRGERAADRAWSSASSSRIVALLDPTGDTTRSRNLPSGAPTDGSEPPDGADPWRGPSQSGRPEPPGRPSPSARGRRRGPRSVRGRAGPRSAARTAVPDHVRHPLPQRPGEQLAAPGGTLVDHARQVRGDLAAARA